MGTGKTGIWVAAALVGGFVVGAAVTRASYQPLEAELAEARRQLEDAKKNQEERLRGPLGAGLQALIQRSERAAEPHTDEDLKKVPTATPEGRQATQVPAEGGGSDTPEGEDRLELAAETWRVRSAQARAAVVEAADLDEDQVAALDALIEELNNQVRRVTSETIENWDAKEDLEVRDLVDFAVEMGTLYQDVDDQWRQIVSEDQYKEAQEARFDVFSQIEPDYVLSVLDRLRTDQ